MLRVSKLTDYATVLMAALADGPEELASASDLAERARFELPTVSKLLKQLAGAGLIESRRGVNGGYRLARPASAISVLDIVTAIEGPIGMSECSLHEGSCDHETHCLIQHNWRRIGSPTERRGGAYRVRLLQNNGWIPITPGFVTNGGPNCTGPCITPLHLSASEDALYVGGMFSTITGDPNQQSLAKCNGNAWIGLGPLAMNGTVTDILQTDLGDGTELFVSGNFYQNVPNRLRNIARLTESGWQPVGNAPSTEINGYSSGIASLHSFAGQNGNILFSGRVGVGVPSASRLSGDAWTTFQSTPNGLSTVGFTEATFNSTRRVFALSKFGTPKLWQL